MLHDVSCNICHCVNQSLFQFAVNLKRKDMITIFKYLTNSVNLYETVPDCFGSRLSSKSLSISDMVETSKFFSVNMVNDKRV